VIVTLLQTLSVQGTLQSKTVITSPMDFFRAGGTANWIVRLRLNGYLLVFPQLRLPKVQIWLS
jgi:hypothetical protein